MKTTVELPESLVKQVKLRAVQDGRKLKDVIADLLRKGLGVAVENERETPKIKKDRKTRLPVIQCKHPATPDEEMTPERVAEILSAQEAEWRHGAG